MAEKKKFLLRLNAALWDELQSWADAELRSVNGQIEYVLKQAVREKRKKEKPLSVDSDKNEAAQDESLSES